MGKAAEYSLLVELPSPSRSYRTAFSCSRLDISMRPSPSVSYFPLPDWDWMMPAVAAYGRQQDCQDDGRILP